MLCCAECAVTLQQRLIDRLIFMGAGLTLCRWPSARAGGPVVPAAGFRPLRAADQSPLRHVPRWMARYRQRSATAGAHERA